MLYEFICSDCKKITSKEQPIDAPQAPRHIACEHCGKETKRIWTTAIQTANMKKS